MAQSEPRVTRPPLEPPQAPRLAERTKHFDVKYHWLREKIKADKVELRYINTHEQLADIFTKPLGVMQHNYLKGRLTGFR